MDEEHSVDDAITPATKPNCIVTHVPVDRSNHIATPDAPVVDTANRFEILASENITDGDSADSDQSQSAQQPRRIRAAPKSSKSHKSQNKVQVYIGGVCGDTSEADITSELSLLGVNCSSDDVKLLRHNDNWKSFVITTSPVGAKKLYNKSNFPCDITVRPFSEKSTKFANKSTNRPFRGKTGKSSPHGHGTKIQHHKWRPSSRGNWHENSHSDRRDDWRFEGGYSGPYDKRNSGHYDEWYAPSCWESSTQQNEPRYSYHYLRHDYDQEFPRLHTERYGGY